MTGQRKRKLRGLYGNLHEAERAARAWGYSEKEIDVLAGEHKSSWPAWARKAKPR